MLLGDSLFNLLKKELHKSNSFGDEGTGLDKVFKLNKAALSFFDHSIADIKIYE